MKRSLAIASFALAAATGAALDWFCRALDAAALAEEDMAS